MSVKQQFRDDIQGLRCLAVVPVVLYHANEALVPGGFVGVDVFFVISGFLITRILWRELETNSFSLVGFYDRRVKRLFPALYVMLAATLVVGLAILPPKDLANLGRTTLATTFFASNIAFLIGADYFDRSADNHPLLHTWSLAVEEQFYIAFPILLFLCYRYFRHRLNILLWICAGLSLLCSIWLTQAQPTWAFYLPFSRAVELLLGAIVAVGAVKRIPNRTAADVASWVGLAMIVASFYLIDSFTDFPGIAVLLPSVGTALIILAGQDRTSAAGRVLSLPLFVFIGGISYSLYLWHWPILVYLRFLTLGQPTAWQTSGAVLLALLAAWASWRFIEQPVLRRGLTRTRTLTLGGGVMTASATLCLALIGLQGLPGRFNPQSQELFQAEQLISPRRADCHSTEDLAIPYAQSCVLGDAVAPTTAIWADSFGVEMAYALGDSEKLKGRSVQQMTSSGCPPALDYVPSRRPHCAAYNRAQFDALRADHRIRDVILTANFVYYPDRDRLMDGFERSARGLHAAGKHVTIVYPIPRLPFSAPRALGLLSSRGENIGDFGLSSQTFSAENGFFIDRLDRLATEIQANRIVPTRSLCDGVRCHAFLPAVGVLYFDDIHLSVDGARHVLEESQQLGPVPNPIPVQDVAKAAIAKPATGNLHL